jgi:hypothetical protein
VGRKRWAQPFDRFIDSCKGNVLLAENSFLKDTGFSPLINYTTWDGPVSILRFALAFSHTLFSL